MLGRMGAAAALLVAAPANAAEWMVIGKSHRGAEVSIDLETAQKPTPDRAIVWVQHVYKTPVDGVRELKDHFDIDCKAQTFKTLASVAITDKGAPVMRDVSRVGVRPNVPDTTISAIFDIVCAKV